MPLLEWEARRELCQTSEKISATNFALSDSRKQGFWNVIDSPVLLEQTRLSDSRTLSQQLVTCLSLVTDTEDLFICLSIYLYT